MSDGPHKSLPMRRGWKRLAERADKEAYAPDEIRELLPEALRQDWRAEVPRGFIENVMITLCDPQESLFKGSAEAALEAMRSSVAGRPLSYSILDCAIETAAEGHMGEEALRIAVARAMTDRAARGARQVEEHYHRKSDSGRAMHVRERIQGGIADTDFGTIAANLLGNGGPLPTAIKRTGLDDGVSL